MSLTDLQKNEILAACHSVGLASVVTNVITAIDTLSGTEAGFIDGVTAGTAAASKAVVLGANKEISTITTATITTLTSTTINVGTAEMVEADLLKLDAVTNGTVAGGKAVVVSADKDIGDFRHLAYSGAITGKAGAATPAVALRLGATTTEGLEIKVYDETITLTNAASTNTTLAVPAGAVILSAQANLQAAITGDASGDDLLAKIGLGISGSVVKFGVTSALTKNTKIDTVPDWAVSSGETLVLYGMKTNGTDVCTEKFTGGAGQTVRVRVVYAVTNSLDDAA